MSLTDRDRDALAAIRSRLCEIVGDDAERTLGTFSSPKRVGFWVNRLLRRGDVRLVLEELGCDAVPVTGLVDVFTVAAEHRGALTASALATAGQVYLTNPSSVLAARCLEPRPGEEVLDVAAAPGGKTLQLAAAMGNVGRIAAVEAVKPRFHRMRANLARCGVAIAELYMDDGRRTGAKVPARFARVLLDAPCSSESRIRFGDRRTYAHWSIRKIKECARKQRALLASAFAALSPGGTLVYCTCSFAPEENELVIQHLLRRAPDAEIDDIPGALSGAVPERVRRSGFVEWRGERLDAGLSRALRILPDETWDGFFVCRLRKRSSAREVLRAE